MKRKKERRNNAGYERTFMKQAGVKARSGKVVYIRKEHHDRIKRIIQTIGTNEITLFDYLDNVLGRHFADFKGEISELYRKSLLEDIF